MKKRIIAFNNAAKHLPFVVLTDQDVAECAPKLVRDWLPHPKQHNLVFRVAVREVESWVIADRSAFATFLGISKSKVPEEPDQLADPKRELISLARRSRRTALRQAIVPRPGSKIGPDYNAMLGRFVKTRWNARVAMRNSPSLERAFSEIISFQPVIAKSEKSDERE